jgi:hypothetical protein
MTGGMVSLVRTIAWRRVADRLCTIWGVALLAICLVCAVLTGGVVMARRSTVGEGITTPDGGTGTGAGGSVRSTPEEGPGASACAVSVALDVCPCANDAAVNRPSRFYLRDRASCATLPPIFRPPTMAEAPSVQSTSFDLRTLAFNNRRASAAAPAFSRSSFAAGSAAQARFSASRLKSGITSSLVEIHRRIICRREYSKRMASRASTSIHPCAVTKVIAHGSPPMRYGRYVL